LFFQRKHWWRGEKKKKMDNALAGGIIGVQISGPRRKQKQKKELGEKL